MSRKAMVTGTITALMLGAVAAQAAPQLPHPAQAASITLARLLLRTEHRRGLRVASLVFAGFAALILLESYSAPFPLRRISGCPPLEEVARDTGDFTVLELPVGQPCREALLHQVLHGKPMLGSVGELVVGLARADGLDDGPMRDPAERQHDRIRRQADQFTRQERVTGVDLGADRLVLRGQALDRVGNAAVE